MSLIRTGVPRIPARAYAGRWIIECGKCPMVYRTQPGSPIVECWHCGATTEIVWPPAEMAAGVERLLSMRPLPETRNWFPGETLIDLTIENAARGVFDDVPTEAVPPGTSLLNVEEGRIVNDLLPVLPGRLAVGVR